MTSQKRSLGLAVILAMFAMFAVMTATPATAQTERILHSFNTGGQDGFNPWAGLIGDASGNLYGTTTSGGASGGGTAFELSPKAGGGYTEKILHSFSNNGVDGYSPLAGLIMDASGNLYGTTAYGGAHAEGTVYELLRKPGGGYAEKVLHSFLKNTSDGNTPIGSVVLDSSGNLYGTTQDGGSRNAGTVFELSPATGGA